METKYQNDNDDKSSNHSHRSLAAHYNSFDATNVQVKSKDKIKLDPLLTFGDRRGYLHRHSEYKEYIKTERNSTNADLEGVEFNNEIK